jgi:hypothetical protein
MLKMWTVVGWIGIVIIGAILIVNAACMAASPRAWFRLPSWIRAQGSLTPEKYTTGWGGLQVRFAGAIMLAVLLWVIYDAFSWNDLGNARGGPCCERAAVIAWEVLFRTIVGVVAVMAFVNAVFMLASPRAWFRLPFWIRAEGPLTEDKYASRLSGFLVRLSGAVMLAVILWVLYDSFIGQ